MHLLQVLRKINDKVSNKVVSEQVLSYDRQHSYLYSLPEPSNDIERSYNQYLCQCYSGENKRSLLIKNIASRIMIPRYLMKKYKPINREKGVEKPIVYIALNDKMDMLPDEIRNAQSLITIKYGESIFLDFADKQYIKRIKSLYPKDAYFVYKVLLKIGMYSAIIKEYDPQEIVVNAETSYTSSILTNYCEERGIKHTDVMHGEKVFWIRDSFFRFTRCYVWTDYHVELFKSMRATQSNYIVSLPPAMKFDLSNVKIDERAVVDYKFYLGLESKQTISKLKDVADCIKAKGKTVKLRPHPVYTDMEALRKAFSVDEIEDVKTVSIEESILTSRNVVSIFSTVLRQAVYSSVRVVVDDCTNKEKYNEMKDLKFWLYEEPHNLLSEELEML